MIFEYGPEGRRGYLNLDRFHYTCWSGGSFRVYFDDGGEDDGIALEPADAARLAARLRQMAAIDQDLFGRDLLALSGPSPRPTPPRDRRLPCRPSP